MEENSNINTKSSVKDHKERQSDDALENDSDIVSGSGYQSDKEGSGSGSDVSDRPTTVKDSGGYEVDSESNRDSNNSKSSSSADQEHVDVAQNHEENRDSDHFEEAVEVIDNKKLTLSKSDEDSDGYEEADESGIDESDVPSDANRHNDSAGYNEESEDDNDVNVEEVVVHRKRKGTRKRNGTEQTVGNDSDASEDVIIESEDEGEAGNGGDWGSEEDASDEDADGEEEEVTKQAVVPRRTGFWDHDDRFDDITVEESRDAFDQSREEARRKKLWDRTAEKWEHDLYKEEEQGPKEEWEKQANDRQNNSQQQRRRQRTVGDYIQNARGRGGRYNARRTYIHRETKEDSISIRVKEEQAHNREERNSPENNSREETESKIAPKNRRYFNKTEDKSEQSNKDEQFPPLKSEAKAVSPSTKSQTVKKPSNHTEKDTEKKKNVEEEKKKEVREKAADIKEKTPSSRESSKKEQRPAKGRGRGITNENLKRGQKTAADFNKEKKVTDHERRLVQKLREQRESKDFDDAEEVAETKAGAKPKRYSSQRLKQANTETAIGDDGIEGPGAQFAPAFPAMHEDMQFYSQPGAVPMQMPLMQGLGGADAGGNSQLMMQHLMQQQQMIQMQMQQLKMHQQQQQPQIVHQPVAVMEPTQSSVQDMLPPQAAGATYGMPTQTPQQTIPFRPVQPTAAGTMPMQQTMQPEEYQMMMNQVMAPRMFMAPQSGGLFIPNQMQQQHQQQQLTRQALSSEDETRLRQRNAAIPIKPPPEMQPTES